MMFFYYDKISLGDIMNEFELSRVYEYYKTITLKDGLLVLMDEDAFSGLVKSSEIITSWNDDIVDGLIIYSLVNDSAYLTLLYGSDETKEDLLSQVEEQLKEKNISVFWIHFFNPIKLQWYPLKDIVHPTLQGVVLNSDDHSFLSRQGFIDYTIEETYYRKLEDFYIPKDVQEILDKNAKNGFRIEFYNENKHSDIDIFCKNLNAPHWADVILSNLNSVEPLPLLVATHDNKVIGFTGPLKKEKNGRGYFAGIGVLEMYRGNKLGKTLFFRLCQELKNMKSEYMTLFTGSKNPAKYIYLQAGFEVVKKFALLKKEL